MYNVDFILNLHPCALANKNSGPVIKASLCRGGGGINSSSFINVTRYRRIFNMPSEFKVGINNKITI